MEELVGWMRKLLCANKAGGFEIELHHKQHNMVAVIRFTWQRNHT
jgi:hypothetical protein